ncbi:hypothetical protein D9757_000824 [Collybiopsis confluens]|uniref:Uncharacterized protein n=1 Tax=Collybiopsis confluens TaxID=2823264 RepID=A0A8H5MG62_9AGAR|nr:hypothetical protein D9757_000824 [Collybiopsis confluens]
MSISTGLAAYLAYPFESDKDFKKGLSEIVSSGAVTDMDEDAIRSMRVFYFNRITGQDLSVEEIQEYERSNSSFPLTSKISLEDGQPVLSFAQIKALIEAGKTEEIPNNKIISPNLNTSAPSPSSFPSSRKKPWEKE